VTLERGMIVVLGLDPTVGHEQRGVRPCVVVSDPDVVADQRFPLIGIVPVTGTAGEGPYIQP
jgi:mRNA-degrading endonuclease toxin of MazEF toxin-antitoxin module